MTRDRWQNQMREVRREAERLFGVFFDTVAALRHPKDGCPWDLKQNHKTLRKYMLEEAYEAVATMTNAKGNPHLTEELGDVLLQVLLNAQIGSDDGLFDVRDVLRGINDKMRRRHPHVFGEEPKGISSKEVKRRWSEIKAAEQPQEDDRKTRRKGIFDKVAKETFPATIKARRIGEQAKRIGFDWDKPLEVWAQFRSEVEEAEEAFHARGRKDKLAAELGDLYFTLGQVCRHLGWDPEVVAEDGNKKFLKRFARMETIAKRKRIDVVTASRDVKEELWRAAKRAELQGGRAPTHT